MNILIGCEHSGVVRDAFRAKGHNAISCDILPSEPFSKHHLKCDLLDALDLNGWDMLIAHPPCTYLCSSGLHWNKRRPERKQKTEDALKFVSYLMNADIDKICIENPVGCISTRIKPATQYIQPYQFGHDASKKTGLWLKGLSHLKPTKKINPRIVDGKPRWANQTDSGQNRLGPSEDRWKLRSKTYKGIAEAMAEQWG